MNKSIQFQRISLKFLLLVLAFSAIHALAYATSSPVAVNFAQSGQQQTKRITGTVFDDRGDAVVGANVSVKGTSNGTITDMDGKFMLDVPSGAILQITYVGYATKELKTGIDSTYRVDLVEDSQLVEEVVVVGYGIVKKKDLTGSVGQVNNASIKDLKIANVSQALAGQVSGVQVTQASAAPGAGAIIRIRGAASLTASSSPLYVVDGFPITGDLTTINPEDIESIEILKDASASAIYGSRASNGVVMVTTKSGKAGKTTVSLDAYYGFQNVAKKIDVLDAQQFAAFSKNAFNTNYLISYPSADVNAPVTSRPSGQRFRYPAFFDDSAEMASIGKGTDWQDEIFRTAPIQNYQMNVSGGDERNKYMFSLGYFNQQGIVIGSGFDRYSARAKIDTKVNDYISLGINVAPSYTNTNELINGHWASDGTVLAALATSPTTPVYNADGTWASQAKWAVSSDGLTGVTNAVANATDIENKSTRIRATANAYAEIAFLRDKSLKFKSTIGADVANYRKNNFRPSNVPANGTVAPLPATSRTAFSDSQEWFNYLNENTLSYIKTFNGRHNISAVAGFTVQKETWKQTYASGSNFPDDIIRVVDNAQVKSGYSKRSEWAMLSYLGRVNYNYNSKYYLTASIRSDGSSRFGRNSRFGSFPSGSIMWRASEEEFVKNLNTFSDLKLRASYGLTGNNALTNNYAALGLMTTDNYVFGSGSGGVVSGASMSSISNVDLTWEKAAQFDFGLEAGFFNNRLVFSFDYYNRKTTDLLLNVDIPSITGFTQALKNIGKVNNYGFEFGLNAMIINRKDFTWNSNLNLSTNRNEVVALGPTGDPIYSNGGVGDSHITKIGHPLGSFYGYIQEGVYMNQEDLNKYPKLATSGVGDVRYRDVNKDGAITAADRTIMGDNSPDFTYGWTNTIRYKDFDFSMLIQGSQGAQVLHLAKRFYENLEGNQNQLATVLDRWISETQPGNGKIPRANSLTKGENNSVSSRWVENASYMRINNLTIGYNLPVDLLRKCQIQRIRLYVSAQNLLTLTNYSGYNPETSFTSDGTGDTVVAPGSDYGMFPAAKSYSLGINITF